jgi:hypothetical protein
MTSGLTVVLVSLLLTIPSVIFLLLLVILPTRYKIPCPEECRCGSGGYRVNFSDSGLNSIPSKSPAYVRILLLNGNSITHFENGILFPENWMSWGYLGQTPVNSEK